MKYLVLELQKTNEHISVLPYEYDNIEEAQEKYYDVLKCAVKSKIQRHGATILDDYFEVVEKMIYNH